MPDVRVTGVESAVRYVELLPSRVSAGFKKYADAKSPAWLEILKATIEHVVYDVYAPQVYQRNKNLITAASREVSQSQGGGNTETKVRLFNDSSKVTLRRPPRGGASKEEVPWQIEEGNYPDVGHGWLGYSLPRPAYLVTTDMLRPQILEEAQALVDSVLAE